MHNLNFVEFCLGYVPTEFIYIPYSDAFYWNKISYFDYNFTISEKITPSGQTNNKGKPSRLHG